MRCLEKETSYVLNATVRAESILSHSAKQITVRECENTFPPSDLLSINREIWLTFLEPSGEQAHSNVPRVFF